jgi:predicted phosphohydrolase
VKILAVYVLGDPHLSLSGEKPMDIFGHRWKDHAQKIKEAWEKTVKPEDTVVLAGDISWAMALKDAEADLAFFHALPGKKILLKGNHDYWWETIAKMNRFLEERDWTDLSFLYNNHHLADGFVLCGTRGWEVDRFDEQSQKMIVREVQRLEHSLQSAPEEGEKIVFFHHPPISGGQEPFLPVLKKYGVRRVFYGHLHGTVAASTQPFIKDGIEYTLISADALEFSPHLIPKEPQIRQNCQKIRSFWSKLLSHFGWKC